MIEINLLPSEFRPREKTNFPLMLTVAVGMLVVGGIILYGIKLNDELQRLENDHDRLSGEIAQLKEDVKKVRDLKTKIARQRARQDTIIEISQSKIMWSLKLQQFSEIMERFPNFWIKRLGLTKSAKSSVTLDVSATGSNLREVARFRDALKLDPNFSYHFGSLESDNVAISDLQPGMNFSEKMDLKVSLPLKVWAPKKKKKR